MSTLVSPLTSSLNFLPSAWDVNGCNGKNWRGYRLAAFPWRETLIQHRHEPIRSVRLRVARDRAAATQQAARRATRRRPARAERHFLGVAVRCAVARSSGALWSAYHLLQPLRPMAKSRRMGPADGRHHDRAR